MNADGFRCVCWLNCICAWYTATHFISAFCYANFVYAYVHGALSPLCLKLVVASSSPVGGMGTWHFVWLVIENHILTWDNLSKRGWIGPSWCCLCAKNEESVSHLLMDGSFTKSVFDKLCSSYKCGTPPIGCSLMEILEHWHIKKYKLCYLHILVYWCI